MDTTSISIIIPVINEANHIENTLRSLSKTPNIQIIVVDGGSNDTTNQISHQYNVTAISAPRGRAVQLNEGARHANGENILFLHADTVLPNGFDTEIRRILRQENVAGGAFSFAVDSPLKKFRLLEKMVAFRSEKMRMPYGDQGLFVRRKIFNQLGGFPELPIMEDYEFVRRLRKIGDICIGPLSATTSARRWEQRGFLKTTVINQAIICAYHFGINPMTLAKWYRNK